MVSESSRDELFAEVDRRYRVADMMVTMHSLLRDKFARRALMLDSAVYLSSIIIAALAFVDPKLMTWLPWSQDSTRIAIGVAAITTFSLSLLSARVNLRSKSDGHGRAAIAYTSVKFRIGSRNHTLGDDELNRMLTFYEDVSQTAVNIPDSDFLPLKSEHYMKLRLSRLLDRHPAASLRLAKMRLRFRHTRRMWNESDEDVVSEAKSANSE